LLYAPYLNPFEVPAVERSRFPSFWSNINYVKNEIGSVKKGRRGFRIVDCGLEV